jgi:putative membrane protein
MKRFNMNEFVWFFILAMFTAYIYLLLATGKMTLYLHPKMVKYSAFSFVILGELTIVQFFKVFTVKTRVKFRSGYMLFFMTLIFGIFFAPGGLNSDITKQKGVTFVSSGNIESIAAHSHEKGQVIEGNEIIFNETNYIHYLEDLGRNLDKHVGKKIKITGFVLKEDNLSKDEFVITRMLMNCCAADSQILGLKAKYPMTQSLEKDQWISVEGIVTSKDNHAVIFVQRLNKIERPDTPYIYE